MMNNENYNADKEAEATEFAKQLFQEVVDATKENTTLTHEGDVVGFDEKTSNIYSGKASEVFAEEFAAAVESGDLNVILFLQNCTEKFKGISVHLRQQFEQYLEGRNAAEDTDFAAKEAEATEFAKQLFQEVVDATKENTTLTHEGDVVGFDEKTSNIFSGKASEVFAEEFALPFHQVILM
ncbi:MAG: hypothetical protein P8P83_01730 [Rickettsiaceae bacterium]|nr:hypothetical protein [Rickettsiaceae bacterium]